MAKYFFFYCHLVFLVVNVGLIHYGKTQNVDKQFSYVGMRIIKPTEGRVWPETQQQSYAGNYYLINPSNFRFVKKGYSCPIIDTAMTRYRSLTFRPPRDQQFSTSRKTDRLPETGYPSYSGNLNSLAIYLLGKCEEWPYLGMDESYEHSVNGSGASISAKSVWGILKGLETFSQLVYKDFKGNDAMAYNKFNVFHWHIVDDQSFPYQSQQFPILSEEGAYNPKTHIYTQADIAQIVEYARQRGIRVIVEFGTPAHTFSWGYGMPEIMTQCFKNGEVIPNWYGPFNPLPRATYQFLEAFFKEVTAKFPDQYIHLGGDEVTFNCWRSNPDIQSFMKKVGFGTDYRKLLNYYFTGLFHRLNVVNRNLQFVLWQEVFDDGVDIPLTSIIQIWKEKGFQKLSDVTAKGYRAIFSSNWYLNRVASNSDWKQFYKVEPLRFSGTDEQKQLVIGGEACLWGEQVDGSNLMSRLWPRASAVAERLWSRPEVSDPEIAAPRLEEHRCRMVKRGISAEPQNGPNYCEADNLL